MGLRSSWGVTKIDGIVAGGVYVLTDVSRMLPLPFSLYGRLSWRGARLGRGSRRRGVAGSRGGREGARHAGGGAKRRAHSREES